MTELPLRPNVCLLIVNSEGKLFMGERLGEPGVWQLPQGGLKAESTLEENAQREAVEELGTRPELLKFLGRLAVIHEYNFDRVPDYALGKWRGQSQSFCVLGFLGGNQDIVLSRYQPEFIAFRWCTVDEVLKFAEAKRLPGYKKALKEFQQYLRELA